MLIEQLKELEEHGVVRHAVFAEVPPRVEYSVTELGQTLQPVITMLCEWGRCHARALAVELADDCQTGRPPRG